MAKSRKQHGGKELGSGSYGTVHNFEGEFVDLANETTVHVLFYNMLDHRRENVVIMSIQDFKEKYETYIVFKGFIREKYDNAIEEIINIQTLISLGDDIVKTTTIFKLPRTNSQYMTHFIVDGNVYVVYALMECNADQYFTNLFRNQNVMKPGPGGLLLNDKEPVFDMFFETIFNFLIALNKSGYFHNDIKLENILVKDNRFFVGDLGFLGIYGDLGRGTILMPCVFKTPDGINDLELFKTFYQTAGDTTKTYIQRIQNNILNIKECPVEYRDIYALLIDSLKLCKEQNIDPTKILKLCYDHLVWLQTRATRATMHAPLLQQTRDQQRKAARKFVAQALGPKQGGHSIQYITTNKRRYRVRVDKQDQKKYITCKREKVYLKDIRGKYRYI